MATSGAGRLAGGGSRWLRAVLVWVALLWAVPLASLAQAQTPPNDGSRVALIVGNGAYTGHPTLANPRNDASDLAKRLTALGFDVKLLLDVGQREFTQAITRFGEQVKPGGVALFFFAGHGLQSRGQNFLLPVDASIKSEAAIRSESVAVDQVLDQLASARVGIVILDACRDNPFAKGFRAAGGGGLAQIDAPKGTLIAYATSPGRVAIDGKGRNSPYTGALLQALQKPERRIEDIFKDVRRQVVERTGEKQLPWESSSMTGDFFFAAAAPEPARADKPTLPAAPPRPLVPGPLASGSPDVAVELAFWDSIKNSQSAADYRAYIDQYPTGRFVRLAKVRLESLTKKEVVRSPVEGGGAERPKIVVGDRWTFVRSRDARPGMKGTTYDLITSSVDARSITFQDVDYLERRTLDLGKVSAETASGNLQWKPFGTSLQFPLAVGKTWKFFYTFTAKDTPAQQFDGEATVEALENIKVPAGSFKAYKVVYRWTRKAAGEISESETETSWYVPEVKFIVKLVSESRAAGGSSRQRFEHELLRYRVSP